jgi:hypothetical protein
VTALVGAAALLLLAAGARTVADPGAAAAALAARRWAVPVGAVRAGALAEAGLGAATLVLGGHVLPALVAVVYAAYAVWVAAAVRAGRPCGCFGEPSRAAHPAQVVVDAGFAVAAGVGATAGVEALVDASAGVMVVAVVVAAAAFVVLTRFGGAHRGYTESAPPDPHR